MRNGNARLLHRHQELRQCVAAATYCRTCGPDSSICLSLGCAIEIVVLCHQPPPPYFFSQSAECRVVQLPQSRILKASSRCVALGECDHLSYKTQSAMGEFEEVSERCAIADERSGFAGDRFGAEGSNGTSFRVHGRARSGTAFMCCRWGMMRSSRGPPRLLI